MEIYSTPVVPCSCAHLHLVRKVPRDRPGAQGATTNITIRHVDIMCACPEHEFTIQVGDVPAPKEEVTP